MRPFRTAGGTAALTAGLAAMSLSMSMSRARPSGTDAVQDIAKQQRLAEDRRRQLKTTRKAAANALAALGQTQLVLGHIHPRWLRAEIERRMDAGEEVSFELVDELRARGPA